MSNSHQTSRANLMRQAVRPPSVPRGWPFVSDDGDDPPLCEICKYDDSDEDCITCARAFCDDCGDVRSSECDYCAAERREREEREGRELEEELQR